MSRSPSHVPHVCLILVLLFLFRADHGIPGGGWLQHRKSGPGVSFYLLSIEMYEPHYPVLFPLPPTNKLTPPVLVKTPSSPSTIFDSGPTSLTLVLPPRKPLSHCHSLPSLRLPTL